MTQLEANLQTKFNMVIEEYSTKGEYILPTSSRKIEMFNLNSLIYIEFKNFVAILEEILNIKLEPNMVNYIHSKLYIENISHFVPSISKAVCSNFVDGRTFAEIRSVALEHGCKPLHSEPKEKEKKRDDFGIGDDDLYRSILYDDDFLLKQLHRQNINKQNTIIDEEEFQSPILLNDPYAQINELKYQTHFTTSEFKNIGRNDIFRGNPYASEMVNKGIKHMYPFEYAPIFVQSDDTQERISHIVRNDSLKKSQGYSSQQSKPRGKQMEFIGDELSERPFVCKFPNCNRAFKRFEHLKRHNKMHTGEKPYKCKYPGCPREFSRSDNLTAHYKTHNITNRNDMPMEYNAKASNFGNY